MSTLLTLNALGFDGDPFSQVFESSDLAKVRIGMNGVIKSTELKILQIAAPRGCGKSRAVNAVLPKGVQVVQPCAPDKERLRIGAIEDSFIYDLSDETPKRSAEARSRQVRKILGEASQRGPVVLVLEEIHATHHSTLRAVKRLLEHKWMGKGPLFTCVMVGQRDVLTAPGLDEIRLRSDTIWLSGLSEAESTDYIQRTVGSAFDPDAIGAIAAMPEARNYLDLRAVLISAMEQAVAEGRRLVSALDVFQASGGGVKTILAQLGMSQADLAKKAGISTTELSRHLAGERDSAKTKEAVGAALSEALAGFGAPQQPEAAPGQKAMRAVR